MPLFLLEVTFCMLVIKFNFLREIDSIFEDEVLKLKLGQCNIQIVLLFEMLKSINLNLFDHYYLWKAISLLKWDLKKYVGLSTDALALITKP